MIAVSAVRGQRVTQLGQRAEHRPGFAVVDRAELIAKFQKLAVT